MLLGYVGVCMTSQGFSLGARTSKNWKGGSGKWGGMEVYTEECLGILLLAEPCKAC